MPDAGLLTVTNVQIADDLKIAKVYVSFLNNKKTIDELLQMIKSKTKRIRYHLGGEINLKYIPELYFYHDSTLEYAEKIDKLIRKIK